MTLNRKILDTIRIILFFANFKKKTNLLKRLRDNKLVYLAIKKANILK